MIPIYKYENPVAHNIIIADTFNLLQFLHKVYNISGIFCHNSCLLIN